MLDYASIKISWGTAVLMLGTALLVWIALGVIVLWASYHLVYGSIFARYREYFRRQYRDSEGWLHTLWWFPREIFACRVCMTAEVSNILVALPVNIALHERIGSPLGALLGYPVAIGWQLIFFCMLQLILLEMFGGMAMMIWTLSDYYPKKYKAMVSLYESRISALHEDFALQLIRSSVHPAVCFGYEDFIVLLAPTEECSDIGCSTAEQACRAEHLRHTIDEWERTRNPHPALVHLLHARMPELVERYHALRRKACSEEIGAEAARTVVFREWMNIYSLLQPAVR